MNDSRKNINWINALKALCMLGVFFVHSQIYYGIWFCGINNYIHPLYVNAFFFVSGYLLFRKQMSAPLIEDGTRKYLMGGGKLLALNVLFKIAIPSTLFALIEFIPKNVLRGRGLDLSAFLWESIGGRTYWFTSALIVAELILLLLLLSRKKQIWLYAIISVALFFVGNYMVAEKVNFCNLSHDPWQFRHGLLALPFLTAGGLYWRYEEQIHRLMKWYVLLALIVAYGVVFTLWSDDVQVLISTLSINAIGLLVCIIACITLTELCKFLPKIGLLTFIGQYSITFYFMSGATPIVFGMLVSKFMGVSVLGYVIVLTASLVTAYLGTYIINRRLPWLLDLRVIFKK